MTTRSHRILTEASGSLTAGYLIESIREAGQTCVGSDIDPHCFGRFLADEFVLMPRWSTPDLWDRIETLLRESRIDLVLPSLDETLLGWAQRKQALWERLGVRVIVSEPDTVAVCQDKWLTHEFFRANGIPCPATSLRQDHPLVKPRLGRGGVGVRVTQDAIDMTGMISQELVQGVEYTIDVFCDRSSNPVYIVPRRRVHVKEGKSTAGRVEEQASIVHWVREICRKLPFIGPVNMQCFVLADQEVRFIEINPRIAGGMALGFAATENWIGLIVRNIVAGEPLQAGPIRWGLEMRRYYAEVFIPPD